MINLETPIAQISKVGAEAAKGLKKLNLETIRDLIFHFPFRYDDFGEKKEINNLKPDELSSISGRVKIAKSWRSPVKKKIITEIILEDNTGAIKAIWFNQPFIKKIIKIGDTISLAGRVECEYRNLQFTNPSYEKILPEKRLIHTSKIVPVYPLTARVTQKQVRFLIKSSLKCVFQVEEWLPEKILKQHRLRPIGQALEEIHFPSNHYSLESAQRRLKFNEFLLFQLQVFSALNQIKKSKPYQITFHQSSTKGFVDSLPFRLTDSQKKAAWEIITDMQRRQPMNRLLEGDVGSGKTLVGLLAILNCVWSGNQAVILVPTEVLARQHYRSIAGYLSDYSISMAIFTRNTREAMVKGKIFLNDKKKILTQIRDSKIDIIIGTHSLIQDNIKFGRLALTAVDEQHRFGVEQRRLIKEKVLDSAYSPHFLSMTATPIPRTLALVLYSDLSLSIIDEMPSGRKKIITELIMPEKRKSVYEKVEQEIKNGRQALVICPLIDPSDKLGVKSVTEEYERLKAGVFSRCRIGFMHGKMKYEEKEAAMADFQNNIISILIATSIIEVGIDIPNATVIMIEDADRFGLAQLHQFRGRVGRSGFQSYCYLFTSSQSKKTIERLGALVKHSNGMKIAEMDLAIRGPGNMYGTEQSGFPAFKIAKLSDYGILKEAQDCAQVLYEEIFECRLHPKLLKEIKTQDKLHFE